MSYKEWREDAGKKVEKVGVVGLPEAGFQNMYDDGIEVSDITAKIASRYQTHSRNVGVRASDALREQQKLIDDQPSSAFAP